MDTNNNVGPEERFKRNLLTLFDIVNDMFEEGIDNKVINNNINILPLIKLFIKKTPGDYMMKRFIRRTHDHWHKIKSEDEEYFKDIGLKLFQIIQDKGMDSFKKEEEEEGGSSGLMNSLSGDHFAVFKNLISGTYLYEGEEIEIFDEERRSDIWQIMHSFVKISICYIHESRKKIDGKYTVEFFPEISVKEKAEEWGVKTVL